MSFSLDIQDLLRNYEKLSDGEKLIKTDHFVVRSVKCSPGTKNCKEIENCNIPFRKFMSLINKHSDGKASIHLDSDNNRCASLLIRDYDTIKFLQEKEKEDNVNPVLLAFTLIPLSILGIAAIASGSGSRRSSW
jgi:hypothetical protein